MSTKNAPATAHALSHADLQVMLFRPASAKPADLAAYKEARDARRATEPSGDSVIRYFGAGSEYKWCADRGWWLARAAGERSWTVIEAGAKGGITIPVFEDDPRHMARRAVAMARAKGK